MEKSVKEFFRYCFRMNFFRVFCVFRGSNLTRSLSEWKGVFSLSLSFSCEVHNSHLIFLSSGWERTELLVWIRLIRWFLLLLGEIKKQARRADRPQAGVKRSAIPAVWHNPQKRMGGRMENDEIINSDENSLLGWISNKYHPMNNAILSKDVLHLEHTVLMTRNALNAAFKWFCRPFGTSSKWDDSGVGVSPLPVVFRTFGTFSRGL